MDNYNEILNKIKNDLQKENIKNKDNIISLYELYNILWLKFKTLHFITNKNNIFKSKNIFERSLCEYIYVDAQEKNMVMYIHPTKNVVSYNIIKEYNNSGISFYPHTQTTEKHFNKIIKHNYDELINIFNNIEANKELIFYMKNPLLVKQDLNDYKLSIVLKRPFLFDINFELLNVENVGYYLRESIFELLEDSKYELAKKIKVDINDLDEILKQVVNEYYEGENQKSVTLYK